MAVDIFGDSTLFEEFEKSREPESSLICQNESSENTNHNGLKKVVLTCSSPSSDDSSDGEITNDYPNCESESQTETLENCAVNDVTEPDMSELVKSVDSNKKHDSKTAESTTTSHKLQFERNKFLRFAKIIDSTRGVPDEQSPAIQVIFQNNTFARKYRQSIELFIRGLIQQDEELTHRHGQESLPELSLKATTPTCVDINSKLPIRKRTDKMWKSHAIIGSGHYYKRFMIDSLGWPLVEFTPKQTPSWILPDYVCEFEDALPVDEEELQKRTQKQQKKRSQECWNCGGEHTMSDCKEPRDFKRITQKRNEFMEGKSKQPPMAKLGSARYHSDDDPRFSQFKAGQISKSLQEALGLRDEQLPQYIYRMRLIGYPPGWMEDAQGDKSGLVIFDGTDSDLDNSVSEPGPIDLNKIIEYPGFTVKLPDHIVDESELFGMPPIQEHQLKSALQKEQKKNKRKSTGTHEKRKRICLDKSSSEMDVDALDSENESVISGSEFVPPMPIETPPSKPPLPFDTPPVTPGSTPQRARHMYAPTPMTPPPLPANSPSPLPPLPDGSPAPSSGPDSDSQPGRPGSPSLEALEAEYRTLTEQLDDDSTDDTQELIDESEMPSKSIAGVAQSPQPGPSSGISTPEGRSMSKDYGTPIVMQKDSINALPDRENFRTGVEQHLLFENISASKGTFDKIKNLMKLIIKKR